MQNEPLQRLELIDAYLEFLQTGKLYPFAKMALELPNHSEIFLNAVRDLDCGRSYPFTISKLPEKMRDRNDRGRPKENQFLKELRLTFYKIAAQKFIDMANWSEARVLTKKELLSKLVEMEKPKSLSIEHMSLSSQYNLLSKAMVYQPSNNDLESMFEVILLDYDDEYMKLCASKDC